jgi:hypothetical protein
MTPSEQFLTMRLVRTRIDVDAAGDLIRIETRKDDRTELVLTRTSRVATSSEYLTATGTSRQLSASAV